MPVEARVFEGGVRGFAFKFRAFSTFGAWIALGILILSCAALWSDRQEDWHSAELSARNVRVTLASEIARTMQLYDLALLGAAEAIRTPGFERAGTALRFRLLFARAASAEYAGAVLVLDEAGNIRYDSTSPVPRSGNFADRDYFSVHKERADVGLYIGLPYASRLRDGNESIALSRRLFNPDGSFAGVVMGALSLDYFNEKFRALALGQDSAIALLRQDGKLIVRDPRLAVDAGQDLSASSNVQQFQARRNGSFIGTAATDGVERLFSFSHIDNLPLILSVGLATHEVMRTWRNKTMILAPATLLLAGAVGALSFLFERELGRRRRAEAELSRLAGTDALTGLWNRRQFDQVYDREWLRAWREKRPISILFIDADNFKLFNDRRGHGEGDRLLQTIASAVERSARRPGDFVARYGGEEFVVILPDTEPLAALAIARDLVDEVAALQIAHPGNGPGVATVSVGVAGATPAGVDGALRLLASADASLYEAKRQGRNRAELA